MFRRISGRADFALCQQLHYLQVATQKLARAYLSSPRGDPPPRTHPALSRFLRLRKGRPELRQRMGYGGNYVACCAYIDSLMNVATRVESRRPLERASG